MVTGKPFLTVKKIEKRVNELAAEISEDYQGREILAVGILKGAFMFFSDIVKQIQVPMQIDFLIASSYLKTKSSGKMKLHSDLREDIKDRHVIMIEDIVDTGYSIKQLRDMLLQRNPASLKICAFLDKKPCRRTDVHLDYTGFEAPDKFLVGYGLDYENRFRNLPYVALFKDNS